MSIIPKPSTDYTRVSFRLDEEAADELARMAKEAGKSHNLCARDLVRAGLFGSDELRHETRMLRIEVGNLRTDYLQRLAKLQKVIENLLALQQVDAEKQFNMFRGDFASSVNLLLVKAGQLEPAQAWEWVQQTLFQHRQEG
jgi:hypothetical protein